MGGIRDHLTLLSAECMGRDECRPIEDTELIALRAHREFTTSILERYGVAIALIVEAGLLQSPLTNEPK